MRWIPLGACLLLVFGGTLSTACNRGAGLPGRSSWLRLSTLSTPSPTPAQDHGAHSPPPAEPVRIIYPRFDVVRADFPIEDVRHARKIWNHVDELRGDPAMHALLARNGVRVGVALPTAWPAIRALVESCDAQVRRDEFVPAPGMPLLLALGPIAEGDPVFAYGASGRLSGKTFAAGEQLLEVTYAFQPRLGAGTSLRIAFEIRSERGGMEWERDGDTLRPAPAVDVHRFVDLDATFTLNSDEMLVIGAGESGTNAYLLGGRFFATQLNGKPADSVIFITPSFLDSAAEKRG